MILGCLLIFKRRTLHIVWEAHVLGGDLPAWALTIEGTWLHYFMGNPQAVCLSLLD